MHVAKQLSSQTDYIRRLKSDLEKGDSYIKQLEKRILLLEGRLKDARFPFPAIKQGEPRVRFEKEENTRSLVNDYYKGNLSYTALIKSIKENPLRRAGII
jgi:hypothetical protein